MKSFALTFSKAVIGLSISLVGHTSFAEENWPSKMIKIIVPLAPGGSLDAAARILGEELSKEFKQPVIVENKTGASGMIGANTVAKAPADGYTVFMTISSIVQNDILHKDAPYRLTDLTPVAETMYNPIAFSIAINHPAKTLGEFVASAKQSPGKYAFGSFGGGTTGHILGEQLARETGIVWNHIPYRGETPAVNDLLGGHIIAAFGTVGTHKQLHDTNKLRLIAVSGNKSKIAPDVPTFAEAGFPNLNTGGWTGVFVPAKTPKPIVDKLSQFFVKTVQRPEIASRLLKTGLEPTGRPHEEFSKIVARDRDVWAKLINDNQIKVD
ncbi:Bug family tripartite tricarboxylate transporter substrate binding protein [Noviherbaspirillum sp. Root189]|uniref:Bug family tripartite tricarboxylate transporter substrate binding protein n=1 Tax=Noviherbaspirillum sp. Root189 TaxID=1736487 RepID=UPI00070FF7E9|nr:tripartite tricarboxylate transporter substrate binding protein [Noviherbaspirillum sp. Root189]KRB83482.1 hypothetical protein ASE07_23755 [Noviherbaspirillum sp. Root189]